MSAVTKVAGYPVHAVTEYKRWTNVHDVRFTNWWAACGAVGTDTGHKPFNLAGSARRLELCPTCFPGRLHNSTCHPEPVEVPRTGCRINGGDHAWPSELDQEACCSACGLLYVEFAQDEEG